jgi:hypothetical protein
MTRGLPAAARASPARITSLDGTPVAQTVAFGRLCLCERNMKQPSRELKLASRPWREADLRHLGKLTGASRDRDDGNSALCGSEHARGRGGMFLHGIALP